MSAAPCHGESSPFGPSMKRAALRVIPGTGVPETLVTQEQVRIMSDIQGTQQAGGEAPSDAVRETPPGGADEGQSAPGNPPEQQPAPLSMDALCALQPCLWGPVWSDPQLAAEAEELALQIVGKDSFAEVLALAGDNAAWSEIMALARNLAAPRIGWRRVWRAQHELEKSLSGRDFYGGPPTFMDLVVAAKRQTRKPAARVILAIYRHKRHLDVQCRKATRAFDAAVRRHQRRVFGLTSRLQRRVDNRGSKTNVA